MVFRRPRESRTSRGGYQSECESPDSDAGNKPLLPDSAEVMFYSSIPYSVPSLYSV